MEIIGEDLKRVIGNDEEIAVVRRTRDYSKFKKLTGNRSVDDGRISKIKASLAKVGYVLNPIIINECFEVIDGQGRLQTFKEQGLPVDYVIAFGAGIDECVAMNVNQTNWKLPDYINSYCEKGDQHYIKLKRLIDRFPELGLDEVCCALVGWLRTDNRTIREGSLRFDDEQYNESIPKLIEATDLYEEIKRLNLDKKIKDDVGSINMLLRVYMICMEFSQVDMKRLRKRIISDICNATTYKDELSCAKSLEDLYNYKATNRVYISSLFKERSKVIKLSKAKEFRERKEKPIQFLEGFRLNADVLAEIDKTVLEFLNDKTMVSVIYNKEIRGIEFHNIFFNWCVRNNIISSLTNYQFYKQLEKAEFTKLHRATHNSGTDLYFYKQYLY